MTQRVAERASHDQTGGARALLVLVIVMGALIVLGVLSLAGVVVFRMVHTRPPAVAPPPAVAHTPVSRRVLLRKGERVIDVLSGPGQALTIVMQTAQGTRTVLWDISTGQISAELELTTAP